MDELTEVKIQYRMEQWMQLIKEFQSSGMSVRAWCQQNGIKESVIHLPSATVEVKEGTSQKILENILLALKVLS